MTSLLPIGPTIRSYLNPRDAEFACESVMHRLCHVYLTDTLHPTSFFMKTKTIGFAAYRLLRPNFSAKRERPRVSNFKLESFRPISDGGCVAELCTAVIRRV
jgi:hypothetical protein